MIPPFPLLFRIWISIGLMWAANRLAKAAGWITPEIIPVEAVKPVERNQSMQ